MSILFEKIMPPKTGLALSVKKGQVLRVTDLEGKQVVDVAIFNESNHREKISLSYSLSRYALLQSPRRKGMNDVPNDIVSRDYLMEGDIITSTIHNPMMLIARETPEPKGIHKVHNRMCNRRYYESFGFEPRDGCHEIISGVVAPYGIMPEDIPDTLDLFMNYHHDCKNRRWVIEEPVSRPGDFVELEALMDCLVAMSNCPDDIVCPVNGYKCTPVKVEIRTASE